MDQSGICDQQPMLYHDQKQKKQMCIDCLTNQFSILPIQDFHEKQMQNQIEMYEQSLNILQKLSEGLESHKQQHLQTIDTFLMLITKFMNTVEEQQTKLKEQIQKQNLFPCQQILPDPDNYENIMNEIQNKIQYEMINLIEAFNIDKLIYLHNNLKSTLNAKQLEENNIKIQQQMEKNIPNKILNQSDLIFDKKFDYHLITQSSLKKNKSCQTIAFNTDNSLMIAGSSEPMIKVFEFKDDKLKEIQQLNGHTDYVQCVQFMKKSNQFISASYNGIIIFWEQQTNQWQSIQVLKAHSLCILTITINQNEDMLISGSEDKKIKFWQRENNTWDSKQTIKCSDYIYSVSLSNNEDKLIASIYDKQILVIQLQGKEWIINQKILVEQYGFRLCFINQNQFVFQPSDRQYLLIYDYDNKEQKYKQGAEVKYQNKGSDSNVFFPIQYIQQMELILVKNDEYIHLIQRAQNGQYTVEQSINFGTNSIFGRISDDGRYIATWDYQSNEIQIRKRS